MEEIKLRVLFVSSGNSNVFDVAPFIKVQGESLRNQGVHVDYFPILGKGLKGYLRSGLRLRSYLKSQDPYDILHAHYALSGLSALIGANGHRIVLSLMGDDAYGTYDETGRLRLGTIYLVFLSKLVQPFMGHVIAKSENISRTVYVKRKCSIIPNGVDLDTFRLVPMDIARKKLNLPTDGPIVLFVGNPGDPRKNANLARRALGMLDSNICLLTPYPVAHDQVALYLSAASCLVFSSTAEGSPNVIKEAMTCNCPIVSTDVGDVKWVLGSTDGCYLTSFDPRDVSEKITRALEFSRTTGRTQGRERIIELGLDSDSVARRIVGIYRKVLRAD